MKKENNYWLYLVMLFLGALIAYIGCQYYFFKIDTKVNVVTTLISVSTTTVALYLAISLKKSQTKSSNLHSYLQPKLDVAWKLFMSLSSQLSLNDKIEIIELSKSLKEVNQNIIPLKIMFSTFKIKSECIKNLETAIDNLEIYLVENCTIDAKVIEYASHKVQIQNKLDVIHTYFVDSLREINKVS